MDFQKMVRQFRENVLDENKPQLINEMASERYREAAEEKISQVEPYWIVNGFSCVTVQEHLATLESVPGVKKIFAGPPRPANRPAPRAGACAARRGAGRAGRRASSASRHSTPGSRRWPTGCSRKRTPWPGAPRTCWSDFIRARSVRRSPGWPRPGRFW